MITGVNGEYEWLEISRELRDFCELCPEVFADRHVAITSADSGFHTPSETDIAQGWSVSGNIACSPRLQSITGLMQICSVFDEWYVFERWPQLHSRSGDNNVFESEIVPGNVLAFINYYRFRLSGTGMSDVANRFWKQMEWIQPESYLGDGSEWLIFVTRNRSLFSIVRTRLA